MATSKWFFVLGLPKWSLETTKVRTPATLWAIISCLNLWLGRGLKQSYSFCQELPMVCRTPPACTKVGSIPDLYFCHNLCCKCPNGSCEPILNIYTSIVFQLYKKLFNARCFDLYNHSLKVWESIGTPTPKMGARLGVWVFILTFSHIPLGLRPCKPLPWSWAQG
jgi:hypothetical protein